MDHTGLENLGSRNLLDKPLDIVSAGDKVTLSLCYDFFSSFFFQALHSEEEVNIIAISRYLPGVGYSGFDGYGGTHLPFGIYKTQKIYKNIPQTF